MQMVEPSKDLQLVFEKAVKDARMLQHEYVKFNNINTNIVQFYLDDH
jgi:hypothetical protein